MEPHETPDLDADRDPAYVRRARTVSRATQAALAVAVGAALLGVFGGAGPLLSTDVASGDLGVTYDRFGRLDAPLRLAVMLPPGDSSFTLTDEWADVLFVESIAPTPASESVVGGEREFVVSGSDRVSIEARPTRFGVLSGEVVASGGARVPVRAVVYP